MMKLPEAKKLCTKDEFQWAEQVATGALPEMTLKELRDGISVLRKLRNKYRDLEKTQRSQAKRAPKSSDPRDYFGEAPAGRTTAKKELFSELLDCFEGELFLRSDDSGAGHHRVITTTVRRQGRGDPRYPNSPGARG